MVVSSRFRLKKLLISLIFFISSVLLLSKTLLQSKSSNEILLSSEEPVVRPTVTVINPPIFAFWTAKPCSQLQPPTLLAIVHSSPSHVLHRKAIRQTWGTSAPGGTTIRTVFVVGRSKVPKIQQRIQLESEQYGDIVGVEMVDSYNNLTLKHLAGLRWGLENCPGASYFLKADDDAFVDIQRAMKILDAAFSGNLSLNVIACRVVPQGTNPRRSGKWMVTRYDYPYQEYPEYCSGLAYFARPSTLSKVYEAAMSSKVPYLWIDDVFVTGLAAEVARISRLDLGVWFARTEEDVIKWMRNANSKRIMPWIVAEMSPRHWPSDAMALWNKIQASEKTY